MVRLNRVSSGGRIGISVTRGTHRSGRHGRANDLRKYAVSGQKGILITSWRVMIVSAWLFPEVSRSGGVLAEQMCLRQRSIAINQRDLTILILIRSYMCEVGNFNHYGDKESEMNR